MAAAWTAHVAPRTAPYSRRLLEWLAPPRDSLLLDAACGAGHLAIASTQWHCRATGIDLSPGMVEQARSLAAEAGRDREVRFQEGDAEVLPFPGNYFHYVVSALGLMYFPDTARVLAGFRRVLRDPGWLGLVVWALPPRAGCLRVTMASLAEAAAPAPVRWLLRRSAGEALLWRLMEDRIPGRGPSPARFGRPGKVEQALGQAGFADIAVREHTEIWRYGSFDQFWETFLLATPAPPLTPDRAARARRVLQVRCEDYRWNGGLAFPMTALLVKARRT